MFKIDQVFKSKFNFKHHLFHRKHHNVTKTHVYSCLLLNTHFFTVIKTKFVKLSVTIQKCIPEEMWFNVRPDTEKYRFCLHCTCVYNFIL